MEPRGIFKDGFLPRSYRALMEFVNGRKIAEAFNNGKGTDLKGRYFRFDPVFDEWEPDLDETSKIQELAAKAREEYRESAEVDTVAQCIVASYFHFELGSKPRKIKGKHHGFGYIRCRLPRNSPAFEALLVQLSKGAARFFLGDCPIPGRLEDRSFIDCDGDFRKRVEFEVKDDIVIFLKEGNAQARHVSGSPYTVKRLVEAQGLDNDFGRADHRKRTIPVECETSARKRRLIG